MIRLDDQVAIITGSGRGLGAAYARLLAERGARVVRHWLYELLRFTSLKPEFLTPQHPQLPHASARGRARRLRV